MMCLVTDDTQIFLLIENKEYFYFITVIFYFYWVILTAIPLWVKTPYYSIFQSSLQNDVNLNSTLNSSHISWKAKGNLSRLLLRMWNSTSDQGRIQISFISETSRQVYRRKFSLHFHLQRNRPSLPMLDSRLNR